MEEAVENLRKYMSVWPPYLLLFAAITSSVACRKKADIPVGETRQVPGTTQVNAKADEPIPEVVAARFTSNGRVVAIGDIHGDFAQMQAAMRLGGIIDDDGNWSGADVTFVQTGDLLDRGDDEQQIVDFLETLAEQAAAAGGRVVSLNGNHEVMNVAGDLRYVTPGGLRDFEDVPGLDLTMPVLERLPPPARARAAAFLPGGPYAKLLAKKQIIAIVDDTVFVHGGVLEHHAKYGIDAINNHSAEWMLGKRDPPAILQGDDSPIWTRVYSHGTADCAALQRALDATNTKRMVVGHTVQPNGITSACDEKVWRIDVGLAAHYGGAPAALEIRGDTVTALQ